MNKIISIIKIIRIHNLLIASLVVFLSFFLLEINNITLIVTYWLQVIIIMAFGYVVNDILDVKSDKINNPNRVLVNNKLSTLHANTIAVTLFVLVLIVSMFLNQKSQLFVYFFILPLLILYNIFFKKTPLIGNVITSLLLGSVFIFCDLSFNASGLNLLIPAALAFNLSFIREYIKDLHDYKGDLAAQMNTFPILVGIKKACYFISIYIIISLVFFLLPYFYGLYNTYYLITLLLFIEIPLLYSSFLLLNSQTYNTFKKLVRLYKVITVLGLFVIMITKY